MNEPALPARPRSIVGRRRREPTLSEPWFPICQTRITTASRQREGGDTAIDTQPAPGTAPGTEQNHPPPTHTSLLVFVAVSTVKISAGTQRVCLSLSFFFLFFKIETNELAGD